MRFITEYESGELHFWFYVKGIEQTILDGHIFWVGDREGWEVNISRGDTLQNNGSVKEIQKRFRTFGQLKKWLSSYARKIMRQGVKECSKINKMKAPLW